MVLEAGLVTSQNGHRARSAASSLRLDDQYALLILTLDGHEFRIDVDLTSRPFAVIFEGHRITPYTAYLIAGALTSMADAVREPR